MPACSGSIRLTLAQTKAEIARAHLGSQHTRRSDAKVHQEAQRERETVGFDGATRIVQTYLSERFPVSQAGAVLTAYVCCYLLYGRVHSHQVFRWETVVGGVTVVLLAAIIFRWWSRLPVRESNRVDGDWGGLPFAVAVEAGVLFAVLAASV